MPLIAKSTLKSFILRHPFVAERFYYLLALYRVRIATYRSASFGQCQEDYWLHETLKAKNIPWSESGFYVDLGANHPVVFSATYLLYKTGWNGVTVEPIPSLCALHRRIRPRDTCLNVGVGATNERRPFWETVPDFFSSFSEEDTIRAEERGLCTILRKGLVSLFTPSDVVASVPAGRAVNYLTIDTEGLDGEILSNWPWNESMPDIISCEASAMSKEESEADRVLKTQGYTALRRFDTCVFWGSPKIATSLS